MIHIYVSIKFNPVCLLNLWSQFRRVSAPSHTIYFVIKLSASLTVICIKKSSRLANKNCSKSIIKLSRHAIVLVLWCELSGYGETVDIECGQDGCNASREECQPITVPANDPAFSGKKCLEFVRSQAVPNLRCTMGNFTHVLRVHGPTFIWELVDCWWYIVVMYRLSAISEQLKRAEWISFLRCCTETSVKLSRRWIDEYAQHVSVNSNVRVSKRERERESEV